MSSECDSCGLPDPECHCYLYELEERIAYLEDGLDKLTYVVKEISDYIRKKENEST